MMKRSQAGRDRGAVAVEFALVLPIFLMLVFGIFEFGRAYNIQISLSEAARESSRYVAVHYGKPTFSAAAGQNRAVAAATSVTLSSSQVSFTYRKDDGSAASACGPDTNVTSTVTYPTGFLSGMEKLIQVNKPFTLTGKGVMRCGG